MNPIKVAAAMSPEWFAARSQSIGASEIAAAAGLSPYQTALELYKRKRGELPPIEDNDAMRMGRLLEPVVKAEFIRESGLVFSDPNPPMYRHAKYDVITATPDAVIDAEQLFEAKTASWRMKSSWGDQDSDDVPTHYLCQCQQQMAVLNAAMVHLAVLFDGAQLKTFKVLRNDTLIELLIGSALELWDRIMDGRPPEPEWEHPSTPALIKAIHGTIVDTRIELNDEEVSAWAEYESLGEIEKSARDRRELLKARVLHGIGDNFAGLLPGGRMVRRKEIKGSTFTVERKPYIDCRATKADGGRIVERPETLILEHRA